MPAPPMVQPSYSYQPPFPGAQPVYIDPSNGQPVYLVAPPPMVAPPAPQSFQPMVPPTMESGNRNAPLGGPSGAGQPPKPKQGFL